MNLGQQLPVASSDLTREPRAGHSSRSPIWSCSGWGLPCLPGHPESGELLPRLFTLTPRRARGGMFSVALSLGSPPVAVSDHPALWSSDFPPAPFRVGAGNHLINSGTCQSLAKCQRPRGPRPRGFKGLRRSPRWRARRPFCFRTGLYAGLYRTPGRKASPGPFP